MEDRGRRLEPLAPAQLAVLLLAVLGLAAAVAGASRQVDAGPAGPAGAAVTEAAIVRALVILVALAEVVVVGLIAWALWPGQPRRRRFRRRRGNLAVAAASFLQSAAVLVLFWLYLHHRAQLGAAGRGLFGGLGVPTSLPSLPSRASGIAAGQEWLTALIVLAVLGLTASFLLRGLRIRRPASPLERLAERLEMAIEEGIEELEGEPDPRRAVIAAYARMERSLAQVGFPRSRPETALEFLARLLQLLGAPSAPVARLTELYQLAKFSQHHIDESMKRDAIAALREVRDELRARAAAEPADALVPA